MVIQASGMPVTMSAIMTSTIRRVMVPMSKAAGYSGGSWRSGGRQGSVK
jgi:hypothetical protein